MNLDLRNSNETNKNDWIEKRINKVMSEIENEFKFKWNTLEKLFSFKLDIEKKETTQNSSEYRNALIAEIEKKANSWDIISNNEEKLNQAKYEALANKIIEISKLTDEIQAWIQELRAELLNDSFKEISLTSNSLLTKWLYSKWVLKRIDDPKKFTDQLLWLWVWTVESLAIMWKFGYDLWKWIVMSPYHLVQIIRWKAKYDWIEI